VKAIELFAGAGGLALGVSRAGFKHVAVVEIERNAVSTIQLNKKRGVEYVKDWPLIAGDVRKVDYSQFDEDLELLAAGAPCQPFSIGGRGRGHGDERNMFPEVLRAMRALHPKAVLIENVKGLVDSRFREYLEYVTLGMRFLNLMPLPHEDWVDHLVRLRACVGKVDETYHVKHHLLNAADFGVSQWRERVFIVAFRSDLNAEWTPPQQTHSLESLLWEQWYTGEYWERHGIKQPGTVSHTKRIRGRLAALQRGEAKQPPLPAWKTVRDAISDLPRLAPGETAVGDPIHFFNPGARPYRKHTGSPMDEPAKTLKAGGHGVPGGENSLRLSNGRIRYFTVRECARLQSFPDEFILAGTWCRMMRQLGNAVPVRLAEVVANQVARTLESCERKAKIPVEGVRRRRAAIG
jgi:DNA (cytosine-5)-methyltransferase 1